MCLRQTPLQDGHVTSTLRAPTMTLPAPNFRAKVAAGPTEGHSGDSGFKPVPRLRGWRLGRAPASQTEALATGPARRGSRPARAEDDGR